MWKHSSLNLLHKNNVTTLRIKHSIVSEIVVHRNRTPMYSFFCIKLYYFLS